MKLLRSHTRLCLLAPVIALVTACAQPMTAPPTLEASRVAEERYKQEQLLKERQAKGLKPTLIKLQSSATIKRRLNAIEPRIRKSGIEVCRDIWGTQKNCDFPLKLVEEKDELNAWADGKAIYITPRMVSFAQKDEELANILAHEYAHNVLDHPKSTGQNATVGALGGLLVDMLVGSQGLDTSGQFSKLGGGIGQFRYSVDFEKEADYVGLYILARAGFEPNGAKDFWPRFTEQNPNGLYGSQSHPSHPERTLSMIKTSGEIQSKRFTKEPVLPNLRQR